MVGPRFFDKKHVGTFFSTVCCGLVHIMEIERKDRKGNSGRYRFADFTKCSEDYLISKSGIVVRRKIWVEYLGDAEVTVPTGMGGSTRELFHEVSIIHIPVFNTRLQCWGEKRVWTGSSRLWNGERGPLRVLNHRLPRWTSRE